MPAIDNKVNASVDAVALSSNANTHATGVHNLFARMVERRGQAVAIEREEGTITYRGLATQAYRLANLLIVSGIKSGDVVAITLGDAANVAAAIVAVLEAGGVFAPLDTRLPALRIHECLSIIQPKFIITDPQSEWATAESPNATRIDFNGPEHLQQSERRPEQPRSGEEPCSIYFTSGSTGKPKAILGRLKGLDHFVRWEIERLGIDESARISQLTSPSFDGYLKDLFAALCSGGVSAMPTDRGVILEPGRLADWIDVQEISVLHCVPSLFRFLLQAPLKSSYFPGLRAVVLAGEAVLPTDIAKWRAIFGDRCRLFNLYGPTETTITKLVYQIQPGDEHLSSIPIGSPMPGAEALILNPAGKPVRRGAVGEIYIRTAFRSLGYYNAPAETQSAFVPDLFAEGGSEFLYRTGDFGRQLEDGSFEFLGRKDQQVKVRGARVEIGEVENAIRSFPHVKDTAVIDYEDREGSRQLCAYVVCDSDGVPEALHDYLAARLPSHMVPSLTVPLPTLPRTFNGKIDRRGLPSPTEAAATQVYEAPEGTIEEVLSTIYERVLQRSRVGRQESFFDLGGHSLLATQVVSRIRSAFRIDFPLRSLFEAPKIADLAKKVQQAQPAQGQAMPLTRVARTEGGGTLSYEQERMWFLHQLTENGSAYNMPFGLRLRGSLDQEALAASLNEVVRRHEVLRTRFPDKDGTVSVHAAAEFTLPLPVIELYGADVEQQAKALAEKEARLSFDLQRGPVVRAQLLRLGAEDHILLITLHHIVSDGWSTGVMVREFGTLYQASRNKEASPLPELPIQYADYAVWQRKWLQGEILQERLDYWRRRLDGVESRLLLPGMRPRPAVASFKGAKKYFTIEQSRMEALRALSHQADVTLFMGALGVFLVLLEHYTGQQDLVVGSIIANRDRAELEPLIGFLANTIVLRNNLSGSPSFLELLRGVREVCLDAYANQIPPEKLMQYMAGTGQASKQPLYDVWFQVDRPRQQQLHLDGLEWKDFREDNSRDAAADKVADDLPFELSLILFDDPSGPTWAKIEYDTSLFPDSLIQQISMDYCRFIDVLAASPSEALDQLVLDSDQTTASPALRADPGQD